MSKKTQKKVEGLLFEIYDNGVQQKECDLTSYFERIEQVLNLACAINWVACEERMPKPRQRVLITDGSLVVEAHLNSRNGYWDGWNITGTENLGDITMWAYKPNPPCL